MAEQYTKVAIGDIGTQLFWYNKSTSKFEYALPITAGAEFGGDTESFEAPETDLDYIPKVSGRKSINDIEYTINFTKVKYARAEAIISNTEVQTYMEVLSDGSAMVFQGTSSMPSLTAGDVRQITLTIIPSYIKFIQDIFNLTKAESDALNGLSLGLTFADGGEIAIDSTTIPTVRQDFHTDKDSSAE